MYIYVSMSCNTIAKSPCTRIYTHILYVVYIHSMYIECQTPSCCYIITIYICVLVVYTIVYIV